MSTTKASPPAQTYHRRKVPIIKLSSLRPSAQLLIILFLFLQFFTSPSYFIGSHQHQVSASPATSNLQSSTNYRRTSLINNNSHGNHHSKSPSGIGSKVQNDSRSQYFKQRQHQSTAPLSRVATLSAPVFPNEQLIAAESKSTSVSLKNTYNDFVAENKTVSSLVAPNFQCPEQFGYFADSTDCSRYFVCVFGDPLHETCTGGLYFSSELQTCDWPQNVNCQNSGTSIDKAPSLDHSEQTMEGEPERKSVRKNEDLEKNDESSTEPSVDEYGSNDLDQPAFDESIASFIDQNGDVYVHDGPGGLYSLIERTAAISDHDKLIAYSSSASVPSTVNSIEKKSNVEKPSKAALHKKFKPKCSKNCTINQNVQFDDEVDEAYTSQQNRNQQQKPHHQPEHLRPRPNIVKKQLKDYDLEFGNKVDELDDDDDDEAEEEDKQKVNNATTKANYKMKAEIPIITFVASKNDMWNSDNGKSGSQPDRFTNKYTSSPKSAFYSDDPQLANKLSYKFRRSEKDAGTSSPILSDDSILQVFRGQNTNSNRRNYLLNSFNTLPLPFPANLVKPWKSVSYGPGSRDGKSNGKLNGTQNITTGMKSNASSTITSKTPGTELHIFYSYRNPHQGASKKVVANTNLPIATVARAKETSKDPKQSEIFTMRSSDLLMNKNTTSAPTNSPVTTSPSVNLHLDYRYTGKSTLTNRNNGNVPNKVSSTAAPVLHYQSHLYSNYSHYDIFESNKSAVSTTTVSPTTTTPPTTTIALPNSAKQFEIEEEVSPKHNFISYSAPSESSRPKSIPSICDPSLNCKLPKCFCPGTKAPYGFKRSETPQMILLTFDDAVNDVNFPLYEEIFEEISKLKRKRTNPNGCPIRASFFVSNEWTDYGKVQTLFARGHEIASHSITHRFGEKFSISDWRREIVGQLEIMHLYAGIPRDAIRGMRAPFLQIGGDQQFQMLMDGNFTYDSSISIFDNSPPFWPYTLDFAFDMQHDCMISPCPTRSYPGLWEIGLVMWQELMGGGRCTMGNSCNSPANEQGVYELIMSNFKRHYNTNRAPFGLFYQSGWFATAHHKAGFLRFIDEVLQLGDVYFVTNQQALQWMQQPTKLADIEYFKPWQCSTNPNARRTGPNPNTKECLLPNICHVKFRKKNNVGSRYFKTCQTCPADYPWIDNIDQFLN